MASATGAQQFLDTRPQHLPVANLGDHTVFDWSGDGAADILIDDGIQLRLLLNDGNGVFDFAPITLLAPSPVVFAKRRLLAGDINGDGTPELVVVVVGAELHLLAGSFPAAVRITDAEPVHLEFGDFDGDGTKDLCAASQGAINIHWGGASGFTATTRISTNILRGVDVGDLDSDGDLDVVFA